MKKESIIQFVCFITNMEPDVFAPKWEHYAKRLMNKKTEPSLLQQVPGTKSRFRYLSQHEWPDKDFQFSFMDERRSEHFPEHNARVVQIGGYIGLQTGKPRLEEDTDVKLIAFVSHNETDIEFYRKLPLYHHLNMYQAFYESCSFGYVLEFFVPEKDADDLLLQLKQRSGVETGLYRECFVPHV